MSQPKTNLASKTVFFIIKVAKKLFYNTPVHRWKPITIIYTKLFHLIYPAGKEVDVTYEGCTFRIPTNDITILPSMLNNDYEKFEIELLRKLAQPETTFADVGANIGLFSAVASKIVGENGRVFAFEPEPDNFALLNYNLKANGMTNVTTVQTAIGAHADTLKLNLQANSIGTHSLLALPDKTVTSQVEVPVITLDDYFTKQGVWPQLIKIDVEGYEPFVLEGAQKTLGEVKTLMLEYMKSQITANYGVDKFTSLLASFPYLYRIDEAKRRLEPIAPSDFDHIVYMNLIATKEPIVTTTKEGR
jgi:FkbM family methyltransferase